MAEPRSRASQEERSRVVAFIRESLIKSPVGEAEEHVNAVLQDLAWHIEAGRHVRNPDHG